MKEKLTDEIRDIFNESKQWINLEVEYAKYTLAEKVTILLSMLIIGAVCLLLGSVVLIMLAFALAEVLKLIFCPALAYFTVGVILCIFIAIVFLCRKPLLLDPIAKFLTKLFFNHKS